MLCSLLVFLLPRPRHPHHRRQPLRTPLLRPSSSSSTSSSIRNDVHMHRVSLRDFHLASHSGQLRSLPLPLRLHPQSNSAAQSGQRITATSSVGSFPGWAVTHRAAPTIQVLYTVQGQVKSRPIRSSSGRNQEFTLSSKCLPPRISGASDCGSLSSRTRRSSIIFPAID